MKMRTPLFFWTIPAFATLAFTACFVQPAFADTISLQISNLSLTTMSGGTVTFTGTITNDSGGDLMATDFFLNFSSFDPTALNPAQDLGVSSDFLIPNGTTSSITDLFDVTLGSVPPGSNFHVQVQLEDINADLSVMQTVTISTLGSVPVPEPSTFILLAAGLLAALTRKRTSETAAD